MLDEWRESEGLGVGGSAAQRAAGGLVGGGLYRPGGAASSLALPSSSVDSTLLDDDGDVDIASTSISALHDELPLFGVEAPERGISRGHGAVTALAIGNNRVAVGTGKGWVVRYDWAEGTSQEVELTTGKPGTADGLIEAIFMDPSGIHVLACVRPNAIAAGQGAREFYYHHARWKKARPVARLKGLALVTAVSWNKSHITEASTSSVLVSTAGGFLYETQYDETDKKEKYFKQLLDFKERREEQSEPICDIHMEVIGPASYPKIIVLAVTPTRLYAFIGHGSLEQTLAPYADRLAPVIELPGNMPYSQLQLYSMRKGRAERFAWLAGPGLYHGRLLLSAQAHSQASYVAPGDEDIVADAALLPYKAFQPEDVTPISMTVTDFHFLLLYQDKLQEEKFPKRMLQEGGDVLGLVKDSVAGSLFIYSEHCLFEVTIRDEERDVWKLHLERADYEQALEHTRNTLQRDTVYAKQAATAYSQGQYTQAAMLYAKVQTPAAASFEEVALKFVAVRDSEALLTFLLHKLDHLSREDRSQITMVATWATELYLDKLNRLMPDGAEDPSSIIAAGDDDDPSAAYKETVDEFCAFLKDHVDALDEATTVRLLGSYGRTHELVYYAELKGDHETVLSHHIQRGDAAKALSLLRRPRVPQELVYKFAPALMALDPVATVDAWIAAGANLTPRRLVPALLRYTQSLTYSNDNAAASGSGRNEAIRYLEYCVRRLLCEDQALHNLLLSLYAELDDETHLLRFLSQTWPVAGMETTRYDPKYALRRCLEKGRLRSCVRVYSALGMYEEAVSLALQVDVGLAKQEANKPEDDDALRKRLWLRVAQHIVQSMAHQDQQANGVDHEVEKENIRRAISFLKETDGLLKIEDILPFFPDFVLIDDFKDAICASLEEYNRQIEALRAEMDDATRRAETIRKDISGLSQRCTVLSRDEPCGICARPLLAQDGSTIITSNHAGSVISSNSNLPFAPFYAFPCSHAFHSDCLLTHVFKVSGTTQRERITDLKRQVTSLADEARNNKGALTVRMALDEIVAAECPFCGELMVRTITQPFVLPEEAPFADSWLIDARVPPPSGTFEIGSVY
eukprot:jgi/Chlat1/3806/Chrsp259S03935